jgi:ligand-binding sensor domain-containing protein
MRINCLLIFALFFSVGQASAQNTVGLPQIINYSRSDFHAGSQTWSIDQDSRGIMYFANNEGLITYDGNYWKVYSLPNKTIMRSLAIDAKDRIYVGGQDEIGYFQPDQKGILQYTSLKNLISKDQNTFADIWSIQIFNHSVFFQASDRLFEYKNNQMKVHLPKMSWQFVKKVGTRFVLQDKGNGLFQFKDEALQPFINSRILDDALISGMIETGNDSVLITTKRDGFYLLSKDSISKISGKEFSSNRHIYISGEINDNEFVAGTTSEGCLIMNFDGQIVQKISTNEGLQNSNVLCVFLDKDKNLWAGLNNGISFIAYNSAIKYIKPDKGNEVPGYSTRIFDRKLYIGTADGAFMVPLNDSNKDLSFSKGNFTEVKNTAGEVWRLDEVNGQLLLAHNYGTSRIQNDESFPIAKGDGSWLFLPAAASMPSPNILVGTYTGLKMLNFSQNKFTDAGSINGLYESFRFLAIDRDQSIWASHPYRGIYKLHLSPDNKNFKAQLFTDKDGLPSKLENYVFKIKNKVVFATSKGIYEYDGAANKFIPSAEFSPVFHDMEVRYLKEDDAGNIWFCSGKKMGVVTFNAKNSPKPFSITYFPELTGQILSGFENIYAYNDENIFIASEKGVIHLNYVKYAANKLKIKVLLGQVRAIGKTDSLIFGGYFQQNLNRQDEKKALHLPNVYNSFHFEYSSPNYGLQKNIEYSYQLKGYDNQWSEWSPKTEKDYTNLPGGEYTFYVKAHDNLGHESGIISYIVYVKPAWYNTVWAYLFYILLFVLLLYFLDQWQKRNLYLQQVKFEEEQKRLNDIHQLTIEKSEKEIIKLQNEKLANEVKFKNKELADATMHLVERGNTLVKVKDELQRLYTKTGNNHDVKQTLQLLKDVEKNNANWEQFASHFNEVNNDFLNKLKGRFPKLSNTDLKVCAYLQLNLSSKEIAQLMNISVRGVEISRYRLRKKLQIPTEQSMNDFLNRINSSTDLQSDV